MDSRTIRLEIASAVDMLDLVQLVTDHVGRAAGLDDQEVHWFGMAVRECVTNAIVHGKCDPSRAVSIEFATTPAAKPSELTVCVRDQGQGFDPTSCLIPSPPRTSFGPVGAASSSCASSWTMCPSSEPARADGGADDKRIRPEQPEAKLR